MTVDQTVDLTNLSTTFPVLDELDIIERSNFLDTIDAIFESGIKVVTLEGASGIGKSILAAQFSQRHRSHAFSLFIRSSNRWGYDVDILREDLCNQMHWALRQCEISTSSSRVGDSELRALLFLLAKHTKRHRSVYYFVVDGLSCIPENENSIQQLILDFLPLDFEYCRFLFTNSAQMSLPLPKECSAKPYQLSAFSVDETRRFLRDVVTDDRVV